MSMDLREQNQSRPWYLRFNIAGGLAIAIVASVLIVVVAYLMYWNDENRKYDIIRGGENNENKALNVEDDEVDRTSPVDAKAAKQKIEYLEKEVKALSSLGNFDPSDLSNENIQIVAPEQPSL